MHASKSGCLLVSVFTTYYKTDKRQVFKKQLVITSISLSPKGYSGFSKSGLLNVGKVKQVAKSCSKPGDNNQRTNGKTYSSLMKFLVKRRGTQSHQDMNHSWEI